MSTIEQRTMPKGRKDLPMMKQDNAYVDILDDLLMGTVEDTADEVEDLDQLIYHRHPPSGKVLPMRSREAIMNKKTKKSLVNGKSANTSFDNIAVELGDGRAKIRISMPPSLKPRLSISRIVECAVQAISSELTAGIADGALARGMDMQHHGFVDVAGIIG